MIPSILRRGSCFKTFPEADYIWDQRNDDGSIHSFYPGSPNPVLSAIYNNSDTFTDLKKISMLKSMTGFGRAEKNVGDKTFLVDIKSLNGKQFELSLKLPSVLKPFEFDIRRVLSQKLLRGSVDGLVSTGNSNFLPQY